MRAPSPVDTALVLSSHSHPGRIGLLLVLGSAFLIVVTVWMLPATSADHLRACLIAAGMAAVAAAWRAGGRTTERGYGVLGYPLMVFGAVAYLGSVTEGIGTSYAGLITVAFIYIGLYAPSRSTLPLIPPALGCWLLSNGVLSGAPLRSAEVRMPVAIIVWVCVGGLLSQHTQASVRVAASLRREAHRDPLTGLRNRRALEEILAAAEPGDSVVLLDLDHFKAVNDTMGHAGGDDILMRFARVLSRSIRDQDLAVRFGGDEFLLYLPGTSVDRVELVVERVRDQWARQDTPTTFSAGIAAVRIGRDGSDAFGEADRFLYAAKAAGRGRWASPETSAPLSLR